MHNFRRRSAIPGLDSSTFRRSEAKLTVDDADVTHLTSLRTSRLGRNGTLRYTFANRPGIVRLAACIMGRTAASRCAPSCFRR